MFNDNEDVGVSLLEKRDVEGYGNLKAFIDVELYRRGEKSTIYNLKVTERLGKTYIGLPNDVQEKILKEL